MALEFISAHRREEWKLDWWSKQHLGTVNYIETSALKQHLIKTWYINMPWIQKKHIIKRTSLDTEQWNKHDIPDNHEISRKHNQYLIKRQWRQWKLLSSQNFIYMRRMCLSAEWDTQDSSVETHARTHRHSIRIVLYKFLSTFSPLAAFCSSSPHLLFPKALFSHVEL